MRLATDSFWIWRFSSTVSCKKISLLLPHQCPNFFWSSLILHLPPIAPIYLWVLIHKNSLIYFTHQYPKWYKLSGIALITVIFLALRVYLPQSWCHRCEGEMLIADHCELYLNFWSFLMCRCVFPFCWVWPNFAWIKFQWYCVGLFVGFVFLCNLSVGSSIFHYFVGVFLSLKWL